MKLCKFRIGYCYDGNMLLADKSNDDVDVAIECGDGGFSVIVTPRKDVSLLSCSASFEYVFGKDAAAFVNGYQSWSLSREYGRDEARKGLRLPARLPIVRKYAQASGDYAFRRYSGKRGEFHGYTYGYVRDGGHFDFFGSLSEREGFTVIEYFMQFDRIMLERDVEGCMLKAGQSFKAFDVVFVSGTEKQCFDAYFDAMNLPRREYKRLRGYTSWYNYFGKIDEATLLRDLDGLAASGVKADAFQIDDGWQSAVGDWRDVREDKFPTGMKAAADAVHAKGMKAGLWLAPIVCAKKSRVAADHPDWIVSVGGKPVIGAVAWGGAYVLDILRDDVKEYLRRVFARVLDEWGYDMVKLDFLYAAAIIPREGKTRGEIMCECMDFLRELVGDKLILGCGVPLGACFGKVDFCRVGCDVDLSFKEKFYAKCTNLEIVSTKNSIVDTVFRRQLDGRAFVNDPDVCFFRKGNIAFDASQKRLLSYVDGLCAGVAFVSDDIGEYDGEQTAALEEFFAAHAQEVNAAHLRGSNIELDVKGSGGAEAKRVTLDMRKGKIV